MFLDAKGVATLLGISVKTLDNLILRKKAPPFFRVGRVRRWRKDDVLAWTEERIEQENKSDSH